VCVGTVHSTSGRLDFVGPCAYARQVDTQRVTVSAQGLTSQALLEALSYEMPEADRGQGLAVEPTSTDTRMLDPTVLAAIVGAGGTSLGAIIGGLFALAQARAGGKLIIQGASGARIEAPASISDQELDDLVDRARSLDVVHLHVAGSVR